MSAEQPNAKHAGPKLSKEEKKALKEAKRAEKEARKAARAAEMGRNAPVIEAPGDAPFGDIRLVQSQFKTERKFVEVGTLDASMSGETVWVRARVATVRLKGKTCFLVLRRGYSTVQVALFAGENGVTREMVKYAGRIPAESVVDLQGLVTCPPEPTATSQSGVELMATSVYVISVCESLPFTLEDAARPDDKVEAGEGGTVGQETRLDWRWVDVRTPANHAIFRLQSFVCRYFREYFMDRDFVEVHTPKITPGVSEGGASVFRLDYFGRNACLAQSPQLYKQMTAACSDLFKVFEIGPVFRAENSNTHRHLCEFTGLDFEMEIVEHYHEVLHVLGNMFVFMFDKINENCGKELAAVAEQHGYEPLKYLRETLVLSFPQAVEMLREAGVEIGDYDDFSTAQEKRLGELVRAKYDTDFYIVDKYPLAARPFYTMPCPDDPNYTNSYDVFLRGEEITSGAQRIHDVELLKKRAAECGIPADNITAYTTSFTHGAPPHGGAGIGMERVVMLFLGLSNVRKSSFFPRDPKRLEP